MKLPYRSYREGCNKNIGDDVDSSTCERETDNRSGHALNHLKDDTHVFESMHFAVAFSLMFQNADIGMQEKIKTSDALMPAARQMAPTM